MLEIGIKGTCQVQVSTQNCAKTMGSGTLEVFATPAMIALLEKTCWTSVQNALEPGWGTVGTDLQIAHTAPTPLGMTVTCESELIAIDGRQLTFRVVIRDSVGEIGNGIHRRFMVQNQKFQTKADSKLG